MPATLDERAIEAMMLDYAACLDESRLEDWPEFFVDDCCYKVVSRENVELGLPAPIIYHYSKRMLQDRVKALREALTFEFVYTRHLISNIRIRPEVQRKISAKSNYIVVQTTEEGVSRIYSVGSYLDDIIMTPDGPKFGSRTVIVDTFGIHNLMALPI